MIKIFIESGVNAAQKKGSKRTTNEQNFVETLVAHYFPMLSWVQIILLLGLTERSVAQYAACICGSVNYEGLAQHYGIETAIMDLTNSFGVAAFSLPHGMTVWQTGTTLSWTRYTKE